VQRSSVVQPVSDDFFDVFDIRFVSGEVWPGGVRIGPPYPAVISEQLARQVYGDANAALGPHSRSRWPSGSSASRGIRAIMASNSRTKR
jgi:hypothetical protein